jgi:hypothetical protein
MRRAPLPAGLLRRVSAQEHARQQRLHGTAWPDELVTPAPYGHWRNWGVDRSFALPAWLHHCSQPLFLLGHRAAQATTQIDAVQRLIWVSLGCRVTQHAGARRWRPVLKQAGLGQAYPLV